MAGSIVLELHVPGFDPCEVALSELIVKSDWMTADDVVKLGSLLPGEVWHHVGAPDVYAKRIA